MCSKRFSFAGARQSRSESFVSIMSRDKCLGGGPAYWSVGLLVEHELDVERRLLAAPVDALQGGGRCVSIRDVVDGPGVLDNLLQMRRVLRILFGLCPRSRRGRRLQPVTQAFDRQREAER